MEKHNISLDFKNKEQSYDVLVGNDLLKNCGVWAKKCLNENTQKVIIVSNQKVFDIYGEVVRKSLSQSERKVCVWLMEDGEEYKNFDSLQKLLSFLGENQINRSDAIVALGGGVVGDLAGFASAIYMRGISFLQIPTTFLAMIDSSVGGKTAVNSDFGKNIIGAFYQPKGVLIDVLTLQTLEERELIAGYCEAVKQGAIGSRELFDETSDFLRNYSLENFPNYFANEIFISDLKNLLYSQISFKAEIVMQDEQESTARDDAKSRKILNFGHTTAHALEKITDYKYFKHGEAVGYGILVAAEISKRLEIFSQDNINLLNDVVSLVGKLPKSHNIDIDELMNLFVLDKKAIGNSLQWILLEDFGKPKILSDQEISRSIIKESLLKVLSR